MSKESAEAVAVQALTWLAQNEDLLPVFLGSAGLDAADLRSAAMDPGFLGGVLDFLLMDDAWITAFCDSAGLDYTRPMQARAMLPGGQSVHWT